MPKISNNSVTIRHKDLSATYQLEIFYSTKQLFYCAIPPEFDAQFDHLKDPELKEFQALKIYKHRRGQGEFKRGVSCVTESETLAAAKKLISKLMDSEIKKRPVILLFYNDSTVEYHGHKSNVKHEPIGLQIGITYCIETSVAGGKPIYNIYTTEKDPWAGPKEDKWQTTREEIHIWNDAVIIIDDAPESRAFLEHLYGNVKNLISALNKYTKSPKKLLELIGSNVKLLQQ